MKVCSNLILKIHLFTIDIGEISGPIALEQYVAIADYTRTQPKELTVESGQYLEVIEKHENGECSIRYLCS